MSPSSRATSCSDGWRRVYGDQQQQMGHLSAQRVSGQSIRCAWSSQGCPSLTAFPTLTIEDGKGSVEQGVCADGRVINTVQRCDAGHGGWVLIPVGVGTRLFTQERDSGECAELCSDPTPSARGHR